MQSTCFATPTLNTQGKNMLKETKTVKKFATPSRTFLADCIGLGREGDQTEKLPISRLILPFYFIRISLLHFFELANQTFPIGVNESY